jgi:hypothetical protein
MHLNPSNCDVAWARYRDLLAEAERERTVLRLRTAARPERGGFLAARRRLGAALVRLGRRLEGTEPVALPSAGGPVRATNCP